MRRDAAATWPARVVRRPEGARRETRGEAVKGEMEMTVNVGDVAPAFSLAGTTGPGLDLAEIRGKSRAALFFYPADRTAG